MNRDQHAALALTQDGELVLLGAGTAEYLRERAVAQRQGRAHVQLHMLKTLTENGTAGPAGLIASVVAMLITAGLVAAVVQPNTETEFAIWFASTCVIGLILAFTLAGPLAVALIGPRGNEHLPDWRLIRSVKGRWCVIPPDDTREGRLARRAISVYERIHASMAPAMEAERIRVDAAEQVMEVVERLSRLSELRRELRGAGRPGDDDTTARQLVDLDAVQDSLIERVDALSAYAAKLEAVTNEHGRALTIADLPDRQEEVLDQVAETARDARAVDDLAQLRADLAAEEPEKRADGS
jgi:hypothetical protein